MIDDPELRALFKAESEEHLQTLENGLLRLEAEPRDSAMLEELFRSAHSLKGAARMLGVEGVETLAHQFEDELGAARRGHITMSTATADRLYRGLDAMRKLAREASDGEPAHVDIPRILAQLRGEDPVTAPAPPVESAEAHEADTVADALDEDGSVSDSGVPETTPVEGGVDSLRVPAAPQSEPIPISQGPEPERNGTRLALPEAARLAPVALQNSNGKPALNPRPLLPTLGEGELDALNPRPFPSNLGEGELDALNPRPLLPKLGEGEPVGMGAKEPPAANDARVVASEPPAARDEPPVAVDEAQALVSPATFKIDTIRVEPQKLDALMTMAAEMAVTTTRVARALAVIADLTALSEEWERDAWACRSLPAAAPDGFSRSARHSLGEPAAGFHERESERLERFGHLLGQLERTSEEGITRLRLVATALGEATRSMRLLPFSTIFNLFPRMVRDLSREQGKAARLVVEGGTLAADKHLLEELKDPLMHLLRNAVDHGIELPEDRVRQGKPPEATLWLRARQTANNVVIEVADDGRGLDVEAIGRAALNKRLRSAAEIAAMSSEEVQALVFASGFSTNALITNVSGRGVGLDVVRANIERLKGAITIDSVPGQGCAFRLQAPITLATTRVLLVQVAQRSYALPIEAVQDISLVSPQAVFTMEGRAAIRRDHRPVAAARLANLLELPDAQTAEAGGKAGRERGAAEPGFLPCILLAIGAEKLALFVDALLDEEEVMVKPFGGLLQRVRNVSGATVLNTGEICMVLNPQDLMESARKGRTVRAEAKPSEEAGRRKVLLLAEDSITTRTQEKRILESAGYEVVTAVDGADAFGKLSSRVFDAVVSDVEMPNMDGLALAARIRQNPKYTELPIILVTSLASDADRQRGIDVGANAYITKGTFEQTVLLDTLRRLV